MAIASRPTAARVVRLVRPHRAPRRGGAKTLLFKKFRTINYFSFLRKLEFWQRLLLMIDKVSKSLQSKDMLTSTAGMMLAWRYKSGHTK